MDWPLPVLNINILFTEAILSKSTRKLVWFEIIKMLIAILRNKLIVIFIIIFVPYSFKSNNVSPR